MSAYSDFKGGDAPVWVSGKTYPQFKLLKSPADGQLYIRMTAAGSGATDPSADTVNYRAFGGRAIKSIQRGNIYLAAATISATATITAVVPGKTELRPLGSRSTASSFGSGSTTIVLTNATTITAQKQSTEFDNTTSWELTEFY